MILNKFLQSLFYWAIKTKSSALSYRLYLSVIDLPSYYIRQFRGIILQRSQIGLSVWFEGDSFNKRTQMKFLQFQVVLLPFSFWVCSKCHSTMQHNSVELIKQCSFDNKPIKIEHLYNPAAQIHLKSTIYKYMQATIQLLILKYPALQYFNILEIVTQQQLQEIGPQLSLPFKDMTSSSKTIFKQIRQYASIAQQKFKQCRNLYRILKDGTTAVESIILNNSNLKSVEALQYKVFDSLVQLQLSSNEIRSLSPLKRMKAQNLEELDLNSNCIQSLLPLKQISWSKLKYLNLNHNNISSLETIPFGCYVSIRHIDLSDNFIVSARFLRKELSGSMKQLKHINLENNEIHDLGWLSECFFKKLEKINLRNNRYGSFSSLQKLKMGQSQTEKSRIFCSNYEIYVSSICKMTAYMMGYRRNSGHKLALKVQPFEARSNRQHIQKSRRLVLF